MTEVVIAAARRTPLGKFGGAFRSTSVVDLGAHVMKSVLQDAGVTGSELDLYIMGNVLGAGQGQLLARQAALAADIDQTVDGFGVDMVCSSAMMAVINGAALIRSGDAEMLLVGGMESMSQAGFVMSAQGRWGHKYLAKPAEYADVIVADGLTDPTNGLLMGEEAEQLNEVEDLTREELDAVAAESHRRAAAARDDGSFSNEISPYLMPSSAGEVILETDEGIRDTTTIEKLAKLKPVFSESGTLTAGNSSQLSDGAAALVLVSEAFAKRRSMPILGRFVAGAWAATEPWRFVEAPVAASQKLLNRLELEAADIDLFENNEAFASSTLLFKEGLGIDATKLNVKGGAIALGHPIGCTGARLIVTLLHSLRNNGGGRGLAALCHGAGGGTAVVIESEGTG